MGATGGEGIFLGYDWSSNTFTVWTPAGLVYPRSITRCPECDRWRPAELARIHVLPGGDRERPQRPRVRFDQPATEQGPTAEAARPTAIRRLRINKADLDEHGYEESCAQCRHIVKYGRARAGGVHNERCRKKIIEALQETESGRARLAEQEERITRAMSEHVERADQLPPVAEAAAPGRVHAPRGFLERTEDGRSAGVRPPDRARVAPAKRW